MFANAFALSLSITVPLAWLSLHAPLDPLGLWVQNVSLAVAVSHWGIAIGIRIWLRIRLLEQQQQPLKHG